MDVRQFAFLARQPSAALQSRESFWGLSKRGLAFMLANMMFWQPLVAMADGIVVNGSNTGLGQAGNGVPIVNIATPSDAGLSHNKFSDYNVGQQGLILNNATDRTQSTQLGGIILGNSNLGGRSANVILNEVNGANPSQLKGYTEVAGRSAHVIVANPYGVTCNGCGFINTPRATLTTGKPVVENGQLQRYQVEQGSVAIEGAGLNASNIDQFEIITRSAKINAQIQARHLTMVTGANDVDAQTLKASARAANPADAPQLAIDSSALGGMYAGAITLVGTEAGVGVKLDGQMIASGGDIQLDANGQLRMADATAAKGAVVINAGQLDAQGAVYAGTRLEVKTQGDLDNRKNLVAAERISLDSGGRLTNHGIVEAGVNADNSRNGNGDVRLSARQVDNRGQSVVASRDLSVTASQTLDNQGGTLSAQRQLTASADTLDNRAKGRLLSAGQIDLQAGQARNGQGGLIKGDTAVDARVAQLDNSGGELSSQGKVTAQVTRLDNVAGTLTADQHLALTASGAVDNRGGQITSLRTLDLKAGQVNNSAAGRIASNQALTASVTGLDQRDGGRLTSVSELSLDLDKGHLNNQGGLINAPRLTLNNLDSVDNHQGEISSAQAFALVARSLDNSLGKLLGNQGLSVHLDQALNNAGGLVSANGVSVSAASLDNHDGTVTSRADLSLTLAGATDNQNGEISSVGGTTLKGASLDNRKGQVTGDGALSIALGAALDNRAGTLGSAGKVDLEAASLDNREGGNLVTDAGLDARIHGLLDNQQGSITAKGAIDLLADKLDNRAGKLRADQQALLTVDQLDNRDKGLLNSLAALSFNGSALDNRGGLLNAVGPVRLDGTRLDNSGGRISSQRALVAQVTQVVNQKGVLVAEGDLTLQGASLDNRKGGLVGAKHLLTVQVDDVDNRGGELSSGAGLNVKGTQLDNSDSGKLIAGSDLDLQVAEVLNRNQGELSGKGTLNLVGKHLDNGQGRLVAGHALDIDLQNALDNLQGLISAEGRLTAKVGSLDNSTGKLSSAGTLSLTSAGALLNRGGSVTTDAGLVIASQRLDNDQGGVLSSKGAAKVDTGSFNNGQGARLVSGDRLDLSAGQVNNGQGSRIASERALVASIGGLDQQGGELFSKSALTLDLNHGQLTNHKGLITAPLLVLKQLADVDNQQGEISSAQAFTLAARNLDNRNGKLIGQQGLTLRVEQALDNLKGLVSANGLDLRSRSLDNSQGMLSSRGTQQIVVDSELLNQDGALIADQRLDLQAGELDNQRGLVSGKTAVVAKVGKLDNRAGQLVGADTLGLTGASLDNRQGGLVSATHGLQLNVGAVSNSGGELSSQANVTVEGQRLDNSGAGKVLADGNLRLTVAEVINRSKGLLSGKTGLTLSGGSLDNTSGLLQTRQALVVDLQGTLDNRQGQISAEGTLSLASGELDNRAGSVSSAGALTLEHGGAVRNQGGELVTDGALKLRGGHIDNSSEGVISAKGVAEVTAASLDNSQKGRLGSGANLTLSSGQLTNRDGGRIASAGALDASVTGLDQQGGQLFSNGTLTLDLNHGQLDNRKGLINAPLLMLKQLGEVNNQGGEISSAQAFTLAARSLDNSSGKLLSNQALTLRIDQALNNIKGLVAAASLDSRAASLDNSGGTLTSRGDLDLQLADNLNNSQQGLINANGTLTLASRAIVNQGGSLLGGAIALDLGSVSGDLNNDAGLISTAGPLTIRHLRDLSNRGGEIASGQRLDLTARTLDNSAGKLIGNDQLGVNAQRLINQGGLVSGWQGLDVELGSLDNRYQGTLSSRDGALQARVSGDLQNNAGGALVSRKALNVTAANLDNSAGGILSSAAGQHLTVTGLLNNAQGGLIDSGAALTLEAMTLGNAAGSINAQQAIDLDATTLDNSSGSLVGNGAVTLNLLGALSNTNGKLASAGPLRLDHATQVSNQGGQIASQGLLTLLAGSLDNSNRGTVAAKQGLTLAIDGTLQNNADGLIYSQNGDLDVAAATVSNAKGTLQGQGVLKLVSGDIDNQSGRIIADGGNLVVTAGNLDNRGGVLSSLKGALDADLRGVLKNGYDLDNNRQGGITQGQSLVLKALGGIDNYGGRIAAQAGDALVTTADFDNRNGGLYAKGLVQVRGGNFDNSGDNDGQIAGQRIDLGLSGALNNRLGIIESDSTLAITAASLDNQTGQIRALGSSGATRLQIAGQFDNRNGTLETANTDLGLGVGSFLNGSGSLLHVGRGTFDISTANVTGAGGSIVTRGGLTLNAGSWHNSNVIQAGRLTVNVGDFSQTASGQLLAGEALVGIGGNWSNDGLIASDGSLSLDLGGSYNGNGRLSSRGTLGLNAGQLNLSGTGSIAGGAASSVSVAGLLNNAGRLTSAAGLSVGAGSVNNQGTLGAAQNLTLTTGALVNDRGLLFSGADMGLRVDSLTNSYADVYSLGKLTIDRDGQGSLASSIVNRSASLQSDGSMNLAASTIQNVRAILKTDNKGVYTARIGEVACIEGYNAGDCGGKRNHVWEIVQRDKFEVTQASAASSITTGGNLTLNGGDLLNSSSTIAAAGSLVATVNNLTNSGLETGETETTRIFMSARTRNAGGWYNAANNVTNKYWIDSPGYNPNDLGGLQAALAGFIGMTEREWVQLGSTRQLAAGDQSYAGVMQAGGAVSVTAGNGITNSVVRPGYAYIGSGARTDTSAPGTAFSTRVTLNQQLPPELAQQQVNPLALPGFSLPAGQHGLFRLSTEGGSAPANNGPQSWTMGGASLSVAQRQQPLPQVAVRAIDSVDAAQAGARGTALSTVERTQAGNASNASAIDTALPGTGNGPLLPGRTAVNDGINQASALNAQGSMPITIERVQGLPDSSVRSNPHKYLVETNPVLTDLKQFMSSDYLLANLGYDPDQSAKRLGDGFYEQKLVQQAVVARTGQRLIDGQDTDEKLFKYLMDNAIKSKQQLNLAVGVSLTSEQVAALTHDIVWLENAEVNGEQVLVPVLYLAHSNNRLAPNGALIAGSDVNLIAGQNLDNVGTLRATHNLSAQAGNNLVNSGLVQAGERLALLAGNDLVNKAGGIIAGRDVSLGAGRDVINERTVTSHQSSNGSYAQQRDFVDNAARVEAANNLAINAGRDLSNSGGALESGVDTSLKAGRDVKLTSVEQVVSNDRGVRYNDYSLTQHGASLQAGRDLTVSAGRDISAVASAIEAKRDVAMTATRDLDLMSAANEQHSASKTKKVTSQEDHVQQVSSSVAAGGNVALKAGDDLTLSASRVTAGNEAYLYAGGDVNLVAEQNSDYSYYRKTKTSSSGLSSSQKTRIDSSRSVTQEGSSVSGDTVVVRAGQDIGVSGSNIVSTHDTSLLAGGNIQIESATETFEQSHSSSKKKSGLLSSGGIGFTLGSTSLENSSTSKSENAKASTVGSVLGDVSIEAGKNLAVKGSEVIAGKDITLVGQNVEIVAAESRNTSEQTAKSKSSGLTLALSGTVGSAVDTAYQTTKQATKEEDSRLSALQGIKAGLTGVQAWQAAQENGGMNAQNAGEFVGIAISLGGQKSSSRQTQEQTVSQGSSLTSGNDLTIVAKGNGSDANGGDIRVQGSKLKAGNDLSLQAERDIVLEAAANTQKLDGKNNSSGGAIGASIGFGSNGGGLSIFANANKGTGNEKGNGTTWTETTLDAGNQASLLSGRDTTLKGAQVNADKVVADVGRDLTLQSLQDTDNYKSKQTNVSGGVSVAIIGAGASGSLSVSQNKLHSKYQSVQEQTGLFAGKGGYQIDVGKHTQLDGSVIASTAEADKNRLSTGTLGWSDIENKAEFKSQMASASVSGGNSGSTGFTSNMPSGTLIAYNHSGSASGTTSSAISEGTLEIRDPGQQKQDVATLSHDVEHANDSISPIFDKEKEQRRLRQVQLIGEIGTQVSDIVRTEGLRKAKEDAKVELEKQGVHEPEKGADQKVVEDYQKQLAATDAYQKIMGKYGTSGDYQRVTQAVTAALQGLAGGDIGSALAGASAPYLAQLIKKSTGDNAALNVMAHAVLGAVVAQAQGNSAAAGAAGAAGGELAARLIAQQLYGTTDGNALSEEQKQTISALSTLAAGLSGGLVEGNSTGAVAGAGAGRNAVENNLLANKYGIERLDATSRALYEKLKTAGIGSIDELQERYQACAGNGECQRGIRNEYRQQEKEAGEKLADLYQSGRLSREDYNILVADYAIAMLEGVKQGQRNGEGGDYLNIYSLSGADWTPLGGIANPYLRAIRASEMIAEWRRQGLSDEKISTLAHQDGLLGSTLAPVDVPGIVNLVDNGATREEILKFGAAVAFGKAVGGVKAIDNSVIGKPRVGSANKLPDGQHGFNDIIDNYAGDAAKFDIPTKGPGGEVVRVSELRQIEGSNNGVGGVFEWIVDEGNVTHRRFIPGGQITGLPNQIPKK
ncbi:hemagglutinin repeat-containing protein [Pseudomonas sp. GD03858]|uniref:hemagglutinin repeat-containing protein n=3 Tax=unclassified Pseudomonas TaxID=196821 RepID=UPI0024489857|nr:hemagglutinin repeat-containing protein [Pseudomonas sp. GD03858]MDH0661518.1 hemagglutinin repeat-containing protein [Pseudomonas sp. GD03858]